MRSIITLKDKIDKANNHIAVRPLAKNIYDIHSYFLRRFFSAQRLSSIVRNQPKALY